MGLQIRPQNTPSDRTRQTAPVKGNVRPGKIMKRIKIDADAIIDWETFYDVFANIFGFPDFYGRNMDAWNDCMTHLDDPSDRMSAVTCAKGDYFVLELVHVTSFRKRCPEQYDALVECTAFVNWRRLERGDTPLLMLSYYG